MHGLPMYIIHEPEGFEFDVPAGDEVVIRIQAVENSIHLWWTIEEGKIGVNILPEASNFTVFHNGVDVFQL